MEKTLPVSQSAKMTAARVRANDEFYTQLPEIENELKHYKEHFQGKTVYCNCDDPMVSNFYKYFSTNFNDLGLAKLITTCYRNQNPDLFSRHDIEKAIKMEYQAGATRVTPLEGDGDFRSEECLEILEQADIVVTNPPFSLFREFIAQLVKHGKKFTIIGNINLATKKTIFHLFKDHRVWLGTSRERVGMEFMVPEFYPGPARTGRRIDEQGNKLVRLNNVRWFTNLEHKKRPKRLKLVKRYSPKEFPVYDFHDAIEVSKTKDIPKDYYHDYGAMGVPVTFMDKYNPTQFEIVGRVATAAVNGKAVYDRILIKHRSQENENGRKKEKTRNQTKSINQNKTKSQNERQG